jgi:hypothetical protein
VRSGAVRSNVRGSWFRFELMAWGVLAACAQAGLRSVLCQVPLRSEK